MVTKSNRREFLMLAQKYNPIKHNLAGGYISEKLDGTRCFWDGGISRGLSTEQVPWANVSDPKTVHRKNKIKPFSTGLWSRYGNPIIAPDWWLNQLPCIPLDGELWAGRGGFQLCRSICSRDIPSTSWEQIEFAVIGSPPFESIFANGIINNTSMKLNISLETMKRWLNTRSDSQLQDYRFLPYGTTFEDELLILQEALPSDGPVYLLKQKKLPQNNTQAVIEYELAKVIDSGGEGVVIRRHNSIWTPTRSHGVLKYKPFSDAEGTVVGFTSGRKTNKGSKLLGKIGALILDYKGQRLELAGLTDEEREFASNHEVIWATENAGIDMPTWADGKLFHVNQIVTFRYRELSNDGIPKEARFLRLREREES